MQRRSFLKKAGLGALASTTVVAAPAVAQSNPKGHWRMASTYGPALVSLFGSAKAFCSMVEEATGGNFTIRLYAGGELIPGYNVLEAVGGGVVECGQSASYYY